MSLSISISIFSKMTLSISISIFSRMSLSISIFLWMSLSISISISIFSRVTLSISISISIFSKRVDISIIDMAYRYIEHPYCRVTDSSSSENLQHGSGHFLEKAEKLDQCPIETPTCFTCHVVTAYFLLYIYLM